MPASGPVHSPQRRGSGGMAAAPGIAQGYCNAVYFGVIFRVSYYRDSAKENGSYYLGFKFRVQDCRVWACTKA